MKANNLHTLSDYETECLRVEAIIAKSSRRAKGGWITYLHRLMKEMQEYKENNHEREKAKRISD